MTSIDQLEEGDKVLFNDRKQPLTVSKVENDRVLVSGPGGGKYEIYEENDTTLFCKEGNRRYSSYCNDLRKVGKWEREDDNWRHSKTDAKVVLKKNEMSYWTIKTENLEADLDLPKYGFSDKETAVEEAEKLVNDNPEG